MCGISGIVGSSHTYIYDMVKAMEHRGPDHFDVYIDKNIQLGHNRLSIIDLNEEANQPYRIGNHILVFNGELYNYLELRSELEVFYNFRTNSDTEVLLYSFLKWGKSCLDKFNGMFAFAIWDEVNESLFAARDRFGVKPFYYHEAKQNFYFSSEIKGLWAANIDKSENLKTWANYFVYGSYGDLDKTFWENINELPGGYFLEYSKGKLSRVKWYDFKKEIKKHQNVSLTKEEVKEHYTDLLKDSIRLRFRSDVPVGFNLSGGLDSSALLAFVNNYQNSEYIEAFTFYTGDERYDETPWVESLLRNSNNTLNKILFTAEAVEKTAQLINFHQDEPFGGIPTLAYSRIFKEASEKGIKVLLDGQGMDEQWAGYDYYRNKNSLSTIQGVTKSPFRINVISKYLKEYSEKPTYEEPFDDSLLNNQYRDLFYTKIPRALRFNDRISMAHSTELREPFLDYRLVEFAFSQPVEFKMNQTQQKVILREIVSEYLGDSISFAPKRPLQTPQREWLGEELVSLVDAAISSISNSKFSSWFDLKELHQEWDSYKNGDNNSSFHIWQWINFYFLNCSYK